MSAWWSDLAKRAPLTEAERKQRSEAGEASAKARKLHRVVAPTFTAGFETSDGKVRQTAPILRRVFAGKTLGEAEQHAERKGWSIEEVPSSPQSPPVASHRAETSISVKQGSSEPPSRQAIGLFRQGQMRPDTRSRRGPWDTRTTEAPIGATNATFSFHLPTAYQTEPDRPRLARKSMARALARTTGPNSPHQDARILNPEVLAEAHRYPVMRGIIQSAVQVVRDHQAPTIERGKENKLIPEGTKPGTIVRAYKHAALMAFHKAGLGDYNFKMDDAAKAEFGPLIPFMRYVHRRLFDHMNQAGLKGRWAPFRDEFGVLHRQKKHGKLTGVQRMRMRPSDQFVKIDVGDLDSDILAKIEQKSKGMDREVRRGAALPGAARHGQAGRGGARQSPAGLGEAIQGGRPPIKGGPSFTHYTLQGGFGSGDNPVNSGGNADPIALAEQAISAHALGRPVPEPPGGLPPIAGASIREASQELEGRLGLQPLTIAKIAGCTVRQPDGLYRVLPANELQKLEVPLAKSDYGFRLGSDFNSNPQTQLTRAMRPRMRRNRLKLRLNTQRDLRHLLNGGVTRTERWQLGASSAMPTLKMAKAYEEAKHARDKSGKWTTGQKAAIGAPLALVGIGGANAAVTQAVLAHDATPLARFGRGGKAGLVTAGGLLVASLPLSLMIHDATAIARKHPHEGLLVHNWKDWAKEELFGGIVSGAAAVFHVPALARALRMQADAVPVAINALAGKAVPKYGKRLAAARFKALKQVRERAKATGGTLVHRGSPSTADWDPKARGFNAVYVAHSKQITGGYGQDLDNPGSVTVYRLSPKAKLLNTDVRLAEHGEKSATGHNIFGLPLPTPWAKPIPEDLEPLFEKLVPSSPMMLAMDVVGSRPARLRDLHWAPTKQQIEIMREHGYHGTIGPAKNVALHDDGFLTPLYAQSRYHGGIKFAPKAKAEKLAPIGGMAKRLLTEDDVRAAARQARVPTKAQAEAGNYPMGHVRIGGLDISIETPKSRMRRGVGPGGRKWAVQMPAHYGYIKGSEGADGDHVDTYLGPEAHTAASLPVHVVDQHDADSGKFDEHKACIGFADRAKAIAAYDAAFSDGRGPDRRKAVHTMTFDDFKRWVGSDETTKPLKKGLLAGIAGAAAAGGAARSIARGLAARRVRIGARDLYTRTLKDAVRDHLHVAEGGSPSPHAQAGAKVAFRAAKLRAVKNAKQTRTTGLAAIRTPKRLVAGAAAAGGALGLMHGRGYTMPPLYQSAAQPADSPEQP